MVFLRGSFFELFYLIFFEWLIVFWGLYIFRFKESLCLEIVGLLVMEGWKVDWVKVKKMKVEGFLFFVVLLILMIFVKNEVEVFGVGLFLGRRELFVKVSKVGKLNYWSVMY